MIDYSKVMLEWEGSAPVFDTVPIEQTSSKKRELELRILIPRKASLQQMVERFAIAMGIGTALSSIPSNSLKNVILGFCVIVLLNPYRIKVLSGDGIDPLIDSAQHDEETGEIYVTEKYFLQFCNKANISSVLIEWLIENNFAYKKNDLIIFRNHFRKARVLYLN